MNAKIRISLMVLALSLLIAVPVVGQDGITFISTQFNVVEESEKVRAILSEFPGAVTFVPSEEGPLLDLLRAEAQSGQGVQDVVGALHGTFPTLVQEDLMFDLTDLLNEIEAEYDIADAFVELGRMGTEDYQYYIPWMQATYTMAAHDDAQQ
jgi:multiple sugar transport system substrate-binding protein